MAHGEMAGVNAASDRVREQLTAAGVLTPVTVLESSAKTAALAAAQLGIPVGAIANSLVFDADGQPLLVLTSGAHRVDTARVAAVVGVAELRRADPEFVRTHTGQTIGGVAPVGHPKPIRTLIDVALADFPAVWAAAGHHSTVFATTHDELVRITGGRSVEVA